MMITFPSPEDLDLSYWPQAIRVQELPHEMVEVLLK